MLGVLLVIVMGEADGIIGGDEVGEVERVNDGNIECLSSLKLDGHVVGFVDGDIVGSSDCARDGSSLKSLEGAILGCLVDATDGVGDEVMLVMDGIDDGCDDETCVCITLGCRDGVLVEFSGSEFGEIDGFSDDQLRGDLVLDSRYGCSDG